MIAICTNPFRDIDFKLAIEARDLLVNAGFETIVCKVFGEYEEVSVPEGLVLSELMDEVENCSLVIVIGGDGTILDVSRKIQGYDAVLLGVNLGTMGFMASLEPENLEDIITIAKGEHLVSKRMLLDVSLIRDGEVVFHDTALNDATVHGYGDCITVWAKSGDCNITRFAGDGIVIATPTGSTGYSLSAGGPILEPDGKAIVVTPICPHVYGARSFVLNSDRTIEVGVERLHNRHAFISVDGTKNIDILPNDVLQIRKSDLYTRMAYLDPNVFFDNAYDKLT